MQLFRLKTALRSSIVWCEERTALGDDATEKLGQGALWKSSCLCTPLSRQTNQNPTATKGGEKFIFFHLFFFLKTDRASQMLPPSTSTSTGPFALSVNFIPRQMDGRIRSSPHYTPLLRSLWIQSTKSILLTSAPVHSWHFLQFSRQHQKHQLAARKWEGANDRVR